MTGKISQPSRGQYLVYHISHQTELPWQAGLSPADGDWPDAGQGKVCCRSETALWSQWAGGRSCAAEKSSAVTKAVGHALALCGKTCCWSCCPNGPSRSSRGDWSCTVRATREAGTQVSQRLWVYTTTGIVDFNYRVWCKLCALQHELVNIRLSVREKQISNSWCWGHHLNNNVSSGHWAVST